VTPPAIVPTPAPDAPAGGFPAFDDYFGNPAGIPFPMAVVIGLAGLATVGFVLRGTFGRRPPPFGAVDEGESLTFH
jgi:hypothetical protein